MAIRRGANDSIVVWSILPNALKITLKEDETVLNEANLALELEHKDGSNLQVASFNLSGTITINGLTLNIAKMSTDLEKGEFSLEQTSTTNGASLIDAIMTASFNMKPNYAETDNTLLKKMDAFVKEVNIKALEFDS